MPWRYYVGFSGKEQNPVMFADLSGREETRGSRFSRNEATEAKAAKGENDGFGAETNLNFGVWG